MPNPQELQRVRVVGGTAATWKSHAYPGTGGGDRGCYIHAHNTRITDRQQTV